MAFPTLTSAGSIYRVVDENGEVRFTDKPESGAEVVKVVDSNKFSNDDNSKKPQDDKSGNPNETIDSSKLTTTILYPEANEELSDQFEPISVEFETAPTAFEDTNLTAQLWVDGHFVTATKQEYIDLPNLGSGLHRIQIKLINTLGQMQSESETVQIIVID